MDESLRDPLLAAGGQAPELSALVNDVRGLIDRQEARAQLAARAGIIALACAGLAAGAYIFGGNVAALVVLPLATAVAVISGLLTLWFRRGVDGPRLRATLRDLTDRIEALGR